MLHHVTESRRATIGPLAEYTVRPGELDAYLRSRAEWRATSDLQGTGVRKQLVITFDDGYRNNLTKALPVLERHEMPCLLFVTTGFIDGTVYPYEIELAEVIERSDTLSIPGQSEAVSLHGEPCCRSVYRELRLPLKSSSRASREAFMNQLAAQNDYDRADVQHEPMLSWEEVHSLSEHPLVTIGAHTESHVLLTQQPWKTALNELQFSKERLERKLGEPVRHVSYPYGGSNIVVRQMSRWLGFEYGFTTRARRTEAVTTWNRLALPRIDISELIPDDD
jgi:peptidoglycan/xylan/chitin deacetylase (PgdA/CDA1 family)